MNSEEAETTIPAAGTKTDRPRNPSVCYVINNTNHSTGYAMTASSNAVGPIDHQPNLNERPPASPACVIDFFEARHRLLAESEGIAQEFEIKQEVPETAVRRERSAGLFDALEQAFYWLISAAVLACLALGILGL
jgi:hypothetical protein